MRTIFAKYNPQRNSIDVYTSAGYMPVSYTHLDVYKRQTCAWLAFDFQYIDCRADYFLYPVSYTHLGG